MTDATAQYLLLLAITIALTFVVGRLLVTAGEPFLQEVFRDEKVTRSVNRLLSVLFYLITLGVLAIISVVDLDAGGVVQTLVLKIGVVLLILGIAYGISMLVLIRIRERRRAAQISEQVQQRLSDRGVNTQPASGQAAAPLPLGDPAPPMTPADDAARRRRPVDDGEPAIPAHVSRTNAARRRSARDWTSHRGTAHCALCRGERRPRSSRCPHPASSCWSGPGPRGNRRGRPRTSRLT